jgi:hypothetical protein
MDIVTETLQFYQIELSGNKRGDQDLAMPVYLLLQCRSSWHNPLLCFESIIQHVFLLYRAWLLALRFYWVPKFIAAHKQL